MAGPLMAGPLMTTVWPSLPILIPISSTVWPEPMMQPPATGDSSAIEPSFWPEEANLVCRRELLRQLEISLMATQQSLLARDLKGLEQATNEQKRLQKALATVWPSTEAKPRSAALQSAGATSGSSRHNPPASAGDWCALELGVRRVLHLGRVQVALLARAQRWLRVIANLAAGMESVYHRAPGGAGVAPGSGPFLGKAPR